MDTFNLANSMTESAANDLGHKSKAVGDSFQKLPNPEGNPMKVRATLAKEKLILRLQITRNGELVSFPPEFLEWLHLNDAQVQKNMPLSQLIHPVYRSRIEQLFEGVGSQVVFPKTEFVLFYFEGEVRLAGLITLIVQDIDEDGIAHLEIVNLASSIQQFSKIQDYHTLFNEAQRIAKTGYWFLNGNDNQVSWSDEMYRIHEVPFDFDLRDPHVLFQFVHPEDRNHVEEKMRECMEKREPLSIGYRLQLRDRTVKYVKLTIEFIFDPNDQINKVIGTVQDNTEYNVSGLKVVASERLLRGLFSNLTDMLVVFDIEFDESGVSVDYKYYLINSAFEQKFDVRASEIVGQTFSSHLPSAFQQLHPKLKIAVMSKEPLQDRVYLDMFDGFYDILVYFPDETRLAVLLRDVSLMVEADHSLRESEEKYRQLFGISNDALFMVDFSTGRILDVNSSALQMFGFSKDELTNKTFYQLACTPTDIENLVSLNKKSLLALSFYRANGDTIPIDLLFSFFNWGGRKVYLVSARDATERLASQQRLIESEVKFKTLVENAPDAILIVKNYRVVECNQKAIELFGLEANELIHKTIWNLSAPRQQSGEDSRLLAVEYIQNALLGSTISFEWIFTVQSKPFHADVKVKLLSVLGEKSLQFVIRDISVRKTNELFLSRENERTRMALEGSVVGVWEWNLATNQVYFSPEWMQLLGYAEHDFPHDFEEFQKRIHPDDVDFVFSQIDHFIKSQSPLYSLEFRMQAKNGAYKWILSKGKIYSYPSDPQMQRFVGTHQDISRYKVFEINGADRERKHYDAFRLGHLCFWELDLRSMKFTGPTITFEMFGLTNVTETTLKIIENMVHPEDKDLFMSHFISGTARSESVALFRILTTEGTRFIQITSKPIFDDKQTLVGFFGVFHDVSVFKNEELQLQFKESILSSIQNSKLVGTLILQNDQLLFHTSKVLDITGIAAEELYADDFNILNLFDPSNQTQVQDYIHECMGDRLLHSKLIVKGFNKFGREKWIELQGSQIQVDQINLLILRYEDISNEYRELNELRNNVFQLNQAIQVAAEGILILNEAKAIVFANKTICELLGYQQTELFKLSVSGFVHSSIKPNAFDELIDMADIEGVAESNQMFVSTKTDSIHWVKLRLVRRVHEGTKQRSYVVYIENIDEFRKVNIKLAERDSVSKSLWDNASDAVVLFDSNSNLEYANESYSQLFKNIAFDGYYNHLKSILGIKAAHFFKLLHKGESEIIDLNYISESNRTYQVRLIPVKYINGFGFFASFHDITSQIKERAELQNRLSLYFQIVENSPVGIAIVDKNRVIIQSNSLFSDIFLQAAAQLKDRKIESLFPITLYDEVISKYAHIFAGLTERYENEIQIALNDGMYKWVQVVISAIKDKYGDTTVAVVLVTDLTERKRIEQKIIRQERYSTLKNISNGFANRLNNQLMAIYGSAYLLKSNLNTDSANSYLGTIDKAVQNANDMVQKIMLASGGGRFMYMYFNLNQIIERLVTDLSDLSSEITMQIQQRLRGANPMLMGDPQQLGLALFSLLRSISQPIQNTQLLIETDSVYYEADYEIDSSSVLKAGKYIRIRLTEPDAHLNEKIIEQMFDPFAANNPDYLNEGFDLSSANTIIKKHGGAISVFSLKGNGVAINVYLPIVEDYSRIVQNDFTPDEHTLIHGMANIILVDDEDIVRNITQELLQKLGYNVFSFSTGIKALNFYKENHQSIDLVVLDLNMPEMNGIELFAKMKEIDFNLNAALLTGYGRNTDVDDLLSLGFKKILQKPISMARLSDVVSLLIKNSLK